jgi:hypothetical protein
VLEHRINFGPEYRVYFGRGGEVLVIPLTAALRSASSGISMRRSRCGRITGDAGAGRGETDGKMALTRSFKELVQRHAGKIRRSARRCCAKGSTLC